MFTLVPSSFFDPGREREALAAVALLKESDIVRHIDIPQYDAVLVYSVDEDSVSVLPEMAEMLARLPACPTYNKILCSLNNGYISIAIAQGKTLLLANSYKAEDFTTAQYYIFLAAKSLQINPEVSTIYWMSAPQTSEVMSLYRYFKAVEIL